MENKDDLSYIDNLSREEIVEHLMKLPLVELRVRLKAFENAKKKMYLQYQERLKNDPEFAQRQKELLEKRVREEQGRGEQK